MFEARVFAICSIAVRDKHADNGHNYLVQLCWRYQYTEVPGKRLVTRGPAQRDTKKNFFTDLHGLGPDVVGIFNGSNQAATIERNVEFSRQVIEREVVDNDLRQL